MLSKLADQYYWLFMAKTHHKGCLCKDPLKSTVTANWWLTMYTKHGCSVSRIGSKYLTSTVSFFPQKNMISWLKVNILLHGNIQNLITSVWIFQWMSSLTRSVSMVTFYLVKNVKRCAHNKQRQSGGKLCETRKCRVHSRQMVQTQTSQKWAERWKKDASTQLKRWIFKLIAIKLYCQHVSWSMWHCSVTERIA